MILGEGLGREVTLPKEDCRECLCARVRERKRDVKDKQGKR